MKLKMERDHEFTFEFVNPDQHLRNYWRMKMTEAVNNETLAFLEEVSFALRNLKSGESVTIVSKPIRVTLECDAVLQPNSAVSRR